MSNFKTYRTKDFVTWEVDGKPYLLTELTEGERNALMLATMYKSTGDVKNLTRYEERIEEVTGMVCIVLGAGGSEVLMKPKEQSENSNVVKSKVLVEMCVADKSLTEETKTRYSQARIARAMENAMKERTNVWLREHNKNAEHELKTYTTKNRNLN